MAASLVKLKELGNFKKITRRIGFSLLNLIYLVRESSVRKDPDIVLKVLKPYLKKE